MRITAVKTFAGGRSAWRSWVFVRIYTDAGIVGLGEATAFGKEEAVIALIHSPDVEGYLVGRDPLRIEEHHQVINAGAERWRGGVVAGSALAGVDGALWDIAGQALGAPVHRLLGGPVRDRVKVYSHVGGRAPNEYAEHALARLSAGYTAMKLDPLGSMLDPWPSEGDAIRQAVRVVAAVREAVGERAEILIEAHGRMDPRMAIRLGRELEPFRPFFYEEPVPYEDVEAMVKVARGVRIPLASGEHLFHRAMFRPYLERRAVKIIQPDLTKAGGITECRKIGDMAAVWYVEVVPHNSGGPISTCMALQLGGVLPNFLMLELNAQELPLWEEFLDEPIKVEGGYIRIPTRPGLGRDVREAELAKHPLRPVSSGETWRFGD